MVSELQLLRPFKGHDMACLCRAQKAMPIRSAGLALCSQGTGLSTSRAKEGQGEKRCEKERFQGGRLRVHFMGVALGKSGSLGPGV